MKLNNLVRFLNKKLKIKKIKDTSRNGLQVKSKNEIKKVGLSVDGCLSTFEKAKKAKVDLLIVHHGIKWKPQKYKELTKEREIFLKKNGISFYGVHLPLDSHHKYGNNIKLCNLLDLKKKKKFGKYHGFKVGYKGEFKKQVTINQIKNILDKKLKTKSQIYPFGKKTVKSIGIVSGGGSDAIEDAVKEKLDCFLVGEISLGAYHRARDYKLNMIVAGHYATEILGVKAIGMLLEKKFGLETIFINNPTGI